MIVNASVLPVFKVVPMKAYGPKRVCHRILILVKRKTRLQNSRLSTTSRAFLFRTDIEFSDLMFHFSDLKLPVDTHIPERVYQFETLQRAHKWVTPRGGPSHAEHSGGVQNLGHSWKASHGQDVHTILHVSQGWHSFDSDVCNFLSRRSRTINCSEETSDL